MAASGPTFGPGFDLNAETYPFATVEQELDKAAYFNLFSSADRRQSQCVLTANEFRLRETLRRFVIATQDPTVTGLQGYAAVGEVMAVSEQKWVLVPNEAVGRPGVETRERVTFDPSRRQRFLITKSFYRFGESGDGFSGYGAGSTIPELNEPGGHIGVGAVGTIVEGYGAFAGLEGTYTYCGTLSPEAGFSGNVLLRVVDGREKLRARIPIPTFHPVVEPEPGISYVLFRGQKKGRQQKSQTLLDASGRPIGLDVSQQLRLFDVDAAQVSGGPRSRTRLRQAIGEMNAKIQFKLLDPDTPGTAQAPIPFLSYNRYEISLVNGTPLGAFDADSSEGRTFVLQLDGLPRQAALRFGGFGALLNGRGAFQGIKGLMVDNSVVGLAPHALSTLYVLRLHDPAGRFRSEKNRLWW